MMKKMCFLLVFLRSFSVWAEGDFGPLSSDSLVITHQPWTVVEGAAAGTVIDTLATGGDSTIRYTVLDARFRGEGTARNDAALTPLSAVTIRPSGVLVVNDPTHLLAVNGPLQLNVQTTTADGDTNQEAITIRIADQRRAADQIGGVSWSVGQAAPYPAVESPPGRQGVLEGHSVVVDHKLYAFGGYDKNFRIVDSSYVYDPVVDRWTSLRPLPDGGYVGSGFATDGQDIYLAGGNTGTRSNYPTDAVYRYRVAENRYEPLPALPVPLADGGLAYLDGKLYFVGGTDSTRTVDQSGFYGLNLGNLALGWQTLASLPNPRGHFGTAVVDGRLYVLGGQHQHDKRSVSQDDVHAYDPSTDTWTLVTDLPDVNDVPADIRSLPDSIEALRSAGKSHISSGAYTDGKRIYVVGGEYRHGGGTIEGEPGAYYSAAVLAYEPATDRWWQLPDLQHRATDTTSLRTRSGLGGVTDSTLHYVGIDRTYRTIPLPSFPAAPPALPKVSSLGPQTHYRGDTLVDWPVLAIDSTDTNVLLTFQASGLPTGLVLDSLSGWVSGVVTADTGSYPVRALIASATDSVEVTWVWTIRESNNMVTHLPSSEESQSVLIYPNPAAHSLRIAWPGNKAASPWGLIIMNAQGQRWVQRAIYPPYAIVDVSRLPPAVYEINLTSDRHRVINRRVIVR